MTVDSKEIKKLKLAHKNMLSRCSNVNDAAYKNYGGRGITVCREWVEDREAFITWSLANGHDMHLSLDRIDTNGNYEPSNCRWATISQQLNNQRRNRVVQYGGQRLTVTQWAQKIGMRADTLFRRLDVYGMDIAKAFSKADLKTTWKHGTRAGYEGHQCRCQQCTEANNARHRVQRAKRKMRLLEDL